MAPTQTDPGDTKITGLGNHILVNSPRDYTRIVDSGRISNLQIFDMINLCLFLFLNFNLYFIFFHFYRDFG
jgi:hypothetical protein